MISMGGIDSVNNSINSFGSGILFPVSAIPFVLILLFTFMLKKKIKSPETRIYRDLLFINLTGLSVEIMCTFAAYISDKCFWLSDFILKLYLVYNIIFIFLLAMYVHSISKYDGKKIFKDDKNKKKTILLLIISIIIVYLLRCDLVIQNNFKIRYTTGPSVNFTYLLSTFTIVYMIISMVKNKASIKNKKYIPIFSFIFTIIIGIIIQSRYPNILIMTYIETFTLVIMYFTIENPDVKVLEEVHKAKEISDSANEEKTIFLYNMTNEIRKINNNINENANIILDEVDNKKIDTNLIDNSTRNIKENTAKFDTLIHDMLDISKIDSANVKIYNEKYNVKLILKELVQIYTKECENKGLKFITNIASDIPMYLYGDSVNLKKALSIILDNSVKYTKTGFVELTADTIIKNDVCRLIITVEDSGVGIKADNINKVFTKKIEDNENERHNLEDNLYNARRLIILMNGALIPSSAYNKGTTIKIVLDQKIVLEEDKNLTKYNETYDKKKVLLVDDSMASNKIITRLISNTNIMLDTVCLGSQCLEKIRNKEEYDLILLDEEMEPLDGLTIMKKLKGIRTFNTKVILLTKNNSYEYNEKYLKYGFVDIILKPINKDEFFKKINKCLK